MKIAKKQFPFNFDPPADWDIAPDLYVIHQLLDQQPDILQLAATCFPNAVEEGKGFMGCDGMTVEQVVRAAVYKQFRRLNYRELALHTADSIIGRQFMKMAYGQSFSHQTLQENIARLTPEALAQILQAICCLSLDLGVDDGQKLRSDATVIQTHIHHPTEAALLWDVIRVSCRLLERLANLPFDFAFRDYRKGAKELLFEISNCRDDKNRQSLFKKLLRLGQACLNQVEAALERAASLDLPMLKSLFELCLLRPQMIQIQAMTRRHQIEGETVPVEDKIFSIFEAHTDCIIKGKRVVQFGHKVNFVTGKSNLIFDCHLAVGNWAESKAFGPALERVTVAFQFVPRDVTADGGQASISNIKQAIALGVKNVVFGKTRGEMQNVVSSKHMQTRLKKWRAGIEANISNFKRGLRAGRCSWKGWEGFQQFVLLNVITYNLKVIAGHLLDQIA